MSEINVCGQIVGGQVAQIYIREKSGDKIELGDLLISETSEGSLILQVYNLIYGSQIPKSTREHLAGMRLEGLGPSLEFLEPELRNYVLAEAKVVLHIKETPRSPKSLPEFFGTIKHIEKKDLNFLTLPASPIYLGKVRSGTKIIDVDINLDGDEVLRHHVLIPSTTGRGKSNLVKVMLWSILGQKKFGILVLDPHDEYYGRNSLGLKDHKETKDDLLYYSVNPPTGANTLLISLRSIEPDHLYGIVKLTEAQEQGIRNYFQNFGEGWIENIIKSTVVDGLERRTLVVLQRIFRTKFGLRLDDQDNIHCVSRVFSHTAGESTIRDIAEALEQGKVVILDTSKLGEEAELLIGSIIGNDVLNRYQNYKAEGTLEEKLNVSIVIEEAPRVLGRDKLEEGGNVYSTIAREGRKFKIGLIAITQITSAIPRDILTNLNTKVILGNEMSTERHAIVDSSAQDLSQDDRNIASLDRGEAIVSSIFTKFAVPIQIPKFEDYVATQSQTKNSKHRKKERIQFTG